MVTKKAIKKLRALQHRAGVLQLPEGSSVTVEYRDAPTLSKRLRGAKFAFVQTGDAFYVVARAADFLEAISPISRQSGGI